MKAASVTGWNEMIDKLRRSRVVSVTVVDRVGWRHPWEVRPLWDPLKEAWVASVAPGFVSGLDATMEARLEDVAAETVERLKREKVLPVKKAATVTARLTERPLMRLTGWRAIGTDATPTGASENPDGSIGLNYEEVPPFFLALGVGEPPAAKFVAGVGEEITSFSSGAGSKRLLRALDLVLYQDRMGTSTQWTTAAEAEGVVAQFSVIATVRPNAQERAYLRTVPKWEPTVGATLPDRLAGEWSGETRDERLVATVYLVSPEGLGPGAEIDGTWTAHVQHDLFWNLSFAANWLRPPLNSQNLSLQTGLAGGVGDLVNQFILGQVNDANSAAAQFLGREEIQGRFWSI